MGGRSRVTRQEIANYRIGTTVDIYMGYITHIEHVGSGAGVVLAAVVARVGHLFEHLTPSGRNKLPVAQVLGPSQPAPLDRLM